MKILIELPTWLGDSMMATPAIENIIRHYGNTDITLIGSLISIDTLKNHPNVKKFQVLDKRYISLYKLSKSLGSFDAFFSFRNSFRSKILKFLISSNEKFQFDTNKYKDFHCVEKYNGFINDALRTSFKAGKLSVIPNKKRNSKSRKIFGINPGASYGNAKRWYPEEFAKVGIEISYHYDILIFGGPSEIKIAQHIEKILIKNKVFNYKNIAGQTSISELINQISNLDLFLTGDSGPMHIAASFQIPTVSIFGPTKDNETSQWMNPKSAILKNNLACQPCMKRICPLGHHNCMKLIKANDVLAAIDSLNLN